MQSACIYMIVGGHLQMTKAFINLPTYYGSLLFEALNIMEIQQ